MKCVIYSRVSTQDQDNQRAINELIDYARYKNYEVLGVYHEKITGASKAASRSEFRKLLEYIEKEEVDNILVWELSRLGRSMVDVVNSIEYFASKRINVYSHKEGINTLNEKGEKDTLASLLIGIVSSFAEMERETIKQRSKSGIRANVARGGSGVGKIKPYGFKAVNKRLEIDGEESEIVKKIFDLYINGWGTSKIANYLNIQAIPTKYNKLFGNDTIKLPRESKTGNEFRWVDGTVYAILKNTIYIGKRKHRGEIFAIEPIIEEEIFKKAQLILNKKYNKKDINRKYRNPLKQRIICGKCHSTYFFHKRHDNSDNAYKCLSKRYGKSCGNVSINIDKLNKSIYVIIRHLVNQDIQNESKQIRSELFEKISYKKTEIKQHINEINILSRQENRLLEVFLAEIITKEVFNTRNDIIRKKYDILDYSIKQLNTEIYELNENIQLLDNIISEKNTYDKEEDDSTSFLQKMSRNIQEDSNTINIHQQFTEKIDLFERTINKYSLKVLINGISRNTTLTKIFPNNQDVLVLLQIELINLREPIFFIISQRSSHLVLVTEKKIELINDLGISNSNFPNIEKKTMVELINDSSDGIFYTQFADI